MPPRGVHPSPLGTLLFWATLAAGLGLPVARARGTVLPGWLLGAVALLLLALLATGVAWQGSGIFARPLLRVRTERPELALTFDDGPDPLGTRAVLDVLEAHGHRGTFFLVGDRAQSHPELVAELARRGHGVENHSLHHSYLSNLRSPTGLAAELKELSRLIEGCTGAAPRFFRPPVGLLSPRIPLAARASGLELVAWTASGRDGRAQRSAEDAFRRLLPHVKPGAILVLHDGGPLHGGGAPVAAQVLERLLPVLAERGLTSVPLGRLLPRAGDGGG